MAARKEKAAKPAPPKVTCPACGVASSESYFRDNVGRFGVCSQCYRVRNDIAEKLYIEMFAQDSGADPVACADVALQWGMAFARAAHTRSALPQSEGDGAPPALTAGEPIDPDGWEDEEAEAGEEGGGS